MPECFLALNSPSVEQDSSCAQLPERERLRILIIGSRNGVIETIHDLHGRGFAEAGAWSPLLPAPSSGEVMSILTRDRKRGS
ncbi:MAG: hypothetical protein HC879_14975 [Leptolyngbyaceae cyanobacterium SL_5_9]|nr:hypothetical protein [Leptolyngbyaceae cyanobacterium SL_5_9]NJO73337.1 hypothetical protein [Leptolyngbyaceae cyanobacterium RM1_406_9]